MAEFTLKIRRYDPESGEAPYWDEHTVELEPHRSVLEGILAGQGDAPTARSASAAPAAPRSAARAACASTASPALACHTHLDAALAAAEDGVIDGRADGQHARHQGPDRGHGRGPLEEDPARHAVALNKEPIPEREYIVPRESMIDVTQTMACIQCGACVSDCLSMEVDPLFIGPAALAKAYRFVGDPRDAEHERAPQATSPRTRTASTTARTASSASRPARRASRR